ncbi:hypothetical protein [Vibrio breoganii]|uniref:hypothetical protein n=1 Tax=Vibrio breoganii TaxID=553239 RepID=UPI001F53A82B|nr:hypothetical protein [Vibrio breoganii]
MRFGSVKRSVPVSSHRTGYAICNTCNGDGGINGGCWKCGGSGWMYMMFKSGGTKTTQIGYINRNNQKNHGTRGVAGNDHGQVSYKLECLQSGCGAIYGANGTDVFQRKCPKCQGGLPGIGY